MDSEVFFYIWFILR